jgi:hypothetical protein
MRKMAGESSFPKAAAGIGRTPMSSDLQTFNGGYALSLTGENECRT